MNTPIVKAPGRQWNAHSHDVLPMLGLAPGSHLPAEGMPPRDIQGVSVWVEPLVVTGVGRTIYSKPHRVRCACPSCGKEMSLGRLHQHVKVHA